MSLEQLTFEIDGEVSLERFAQGMTRLQRLVTALTNEVSRGASIDWIVEDLRPGSAVTTVRGIAEDPETVERVVRAYTVVGRALAQHQMVPYSPAVAKSANQLLELLGDDVTAIRFETAEDEITIDSREGSSNGRALTGAYGAIGGRVEVLSRRRGLRFTLYDALSDRAVSCYLADGQDELMRDVWGRRVTVSGWVSRDTITGRPVSIRDITDVTPLTEVLPGSYR